MSGSEDSDNRSEEDLQELELARHGDRAALENLLGRHLDFVRNRVHVMIRQEAHNDTSDLVQSAILRAIEGMNNFKGSSRAAFLAWLGSVVQNTVLQKKRRQQTLKRGARTSPSGLDNLAALTQSPSADALQLESLITIGQALQVLNKEQRRAIELRLVEDADYARVAVELDLSEAAARTLVSRARAALAIEIARLESGLVPPTQS